MASSQNTTKKPGPKKGKKLRAISIAVIAALLLALFGGGYAAFAYYRNRVAPGVTLGARDISGQTREQVAETIQDMAGRTTLTVTADGATEKKLSLEDIGVKVDITKTVDAVFSAKDGSSFSRLNPFTQKNIPLVARSDDAAVQNHLADALANNDGAQEPRVEYDSSAGKFVSFGGRSGKTVPLDEVQAALSKMLAHPGENTHAHIQLDPAKPLVPDEAARTAAQQANTRIFSRISISNGSKKTYTIPSATLASWISFSLNRPHKAIDLTYDEGAARRFLKTALPKALNQAKVDQTQNVNSTGGVISVVARGTDGVAVTDTDKTSAEVITSLREGRSATLTASAEVTKFAVKNRVLRYDAADGDPWALVDLSRQQMYAYKGTTLVQTFNVSTGKPDTPTHAGTYFVASKLPLQTMRGDDYVTPDVQWISYFHGGEGFHSAPWNINGIARGVPKSHGCVNMNPAEAKWLYDFLPRGAMVKVIGSTPSGPVR
ncbi:L,D-transpeptidase family protein [Scardovia wiggsiae]|uniref:L,D-transpeptidase family protein n=1 Tax=Scardovia wiggsiae TaxID=230143 RepID=UPI003BAC466F